MARSNIIEAVTIEEALTKTHFGKFNYLIIVFSGIVLKNVVMESVGISFILPILECDMNLTHQQQGILGAVCFIGIIVSSHMWGFLADTKGRRRTMLPAFLVNCTVTIVSSFSPNFLVLTSMEFINGFILSAGSATVFAYVGEFHSQQYRNRAILSTAFISSFLSIFFPIVAWIFINQNWEFYIPYLDIIYKPWRLYMVVCGVPGLISAIILLQLPESPKYLLTAGKHDEAMEVLKLMHTRNICGNSKLKHSTFEVTALLPDTLIINNDNDQAAIGVTKNFFSTLAEMMWQQTAPLFERSYVKQTLLASLIQFIAFFTAHGVYMWFPYMLNRSMQYTQRYDESLRLCNILRYTHSTNSTYVAANQSCVTHLESSTYQHTIILEVIYLCLLLCVSYSVEKFGRKRILITVLIACGLSGMLALLFNIQLLAIYLFVLLLCCGLGTTILNTIVVDLYPTNLRAMAVSISMMLGRIGSVTGSNLLGIFIISHCELVLYSSAGSLILAAFLSFLLPKPNGSNKEIINKI